MIYFTAHTFNCVCHCIRAMFRVLGMYNFGFMSKNVFMKFMNIPQLVAVLHCAMKRSLVAETSD